MMAASSYMGFPTETVRPTESLDDGGIIIIGGFPTETSAPLRAFTISSF